MSNSYGVPTSEISISDSTVRGIGWQSASSIVQVAFAFAIQIILSRLLTPRDFGVVAYAMIFIGFSAQIAQAGIAPAIVQRREINDNYVTAGFIISVSIGFLVWVTLWFISPVIVHAGNEITILRILSFIFLLNSLTIVSDARLQRYFLFKKLFWIDTISYSIGTGFVPVIFAFRGYGAWSLVIGALVQSILRGILLFLNSPFKVSLELGRKDFQSLFNFGTGMTLARLANFIAGNSSQFIVGTFLGTVSLGLFQRAYQLITTPLTKIVSVMTSVLFPALSRWQDDTEQLRKSYLFLISLASLIAFPLAVFVSASSSEIILVLYGNQWVHAINSLAILSFNAAFIAIFTLSDALARAKGLVYSQFRRHFTYAVLVLAGAVIGNRYGISGVAIGLTGASFLMYLFNAQLALKITGASWLEFFQAQRAGVLLSLFVGGALLVIDISKSGFLNGNSFLTLIIKSLVACAVFLVVAYLMPAVWYGSLKQIIGSYLSAKYPSINWNILMKTGVHPDASPN